MKKVLILSGVLLMVAGCHRTPTISANDQITGGPQQSDMVWIPEGSDGSLWYTDIVEPRLRGEDGRLYAKVHDIQHYKHWRIWYEAFTAKPIGTGRLGSRNWKPAPSPQEITQADMDAARRELGW